MIDALIPVWYAGDGKIKLMQSWLHPRTVKVVLLTWL